MGNGSPFSPININVHVGKLENTKSTFIFIKGFEQSYNLGQNVHAFHIRCSHSGFLINPCTIQRVNEIAH